MERQRKTSTPQMEAPPTSEGSGSTGVVQTAPGIPLHQTSAQLLPLGCLPSCAYEGEIISSSYRHGCGENLQEHCLFFR